MRKNDGSLKDWINEGEMYPITEHIAQAPSVEHILQLNPITTNYTKEVSIATCFVTIAANFILLGYLMLYLCFIITGMSFFFRNIDTVSENIVRRHLQFALEMMGLTAVLSVEI